MRIIISDARCLIDLKKASLLEALLRLPYEIAIPDVMFSTELAKFSEAQKQGLINAGMKTLTLKGDGVECVMSISNQNPRLSLNDCFAYVHAAKTQNSIILTSDIRLRTLAEDNSLEVHGIIWIFDEMYKHSIVRSTLLSDALEKLLKDPAVYLPRRKLAQAINHYRQI